MEKPKVAFVMRELLSETRSYRGTKLPCFVDPGEAIAFYKGLLCALPVFERVMIEATLDRSRCISDFVRSRNASSA